MLSCRLEQLYIPLFGSFSGAALVFMIPACSPVESIICRRVSLIYGYSYPQYVSLITDRKFLGGPRYHSGPRYHLAPFHCLPEGSSRVRIRKAGRTTPEI